MATFTFFLYRSTNKLWEAGKDSLEQTERAFVFLDKIDNELTASPDSDAASKRFPEQYRKNAGRYITRFAIQPRWKNGGKTPTKSMTVQVNFGFFSQNPTPDISYNMASATIFLAPASVEPSAFIEIPVPSTQSVIEYSINPPEIVPISTEVLITPILLVWGRADYEDVFGHAHFTEWCYQVKFECPDGGKLRAGFIQWGEYNRSG